MVKVERQSTETVLQAMEKSGQHTMFLELIRRAGAEPLLSGKGPYSTFAPTDAAFQAMPAGDLAELMKPENRESLAQLVTFHVIDTTWRAPTGEAGGSAKTMSGGRIGLARSGKEIFVDNGRVEGEAVRCSNGTLLAIDAVLNPGQEKLLALLGQHGCTVMARLVAKAGMEALLDSDFPVTIFVPSDEAFASMKSELARLERPENQAELDSFIERHLMLGPVFLDAIESNGSLRTNGGVALKLDERGDDTKLCGYRVSERDVRASNGVLHKIEGVLSKER